MHQQLQLRESEYSFQLLELGKRYTAKNSLLQENCLKTKMKELLFL